MHNFIPRLVATALAAAVAASCRDADPVRPAAPPTAQRPSPSSPRLATSTTGITVLDLGSDAVGYAINASGAVAGQSGILAAVWSPTGALRIVHGPCRVCCNPGSLYPPGCSNTCDQYCNTNPAHDWPAAALGIDDAGDVTGYYHVYITLPAEVATDYQAGFLATAAGVTVDIGALAAGPFSMQGAVRETTPRAINAAGEIAGRSNGATTGMLHGFRRAPGGAFTDLVVLAPGMNDTWADAFAIDARGDVAGYSYTLREHAILWPADGSPQDVGSAAGFATSRAYGMNDSGYVVGAGDGQAFRWSAATGVYSLDPGVAYAINRRGDAAGYASYQAGELRAVVWRRSGGTTTLGTLGGAGSVAYAINDAGQVAGKAQDAAGVWHAVRWDASPPTPAQIVIALYDTTPNSVEGMDLHVTGSATGDAMLSPRWVFDDGYTAYSWDVLRRYADNGTYTATLTVTGLSGATASATATITIANAIPEPGPVSMTGPTPSGATATLTAVIRDRGALDNPWTWRIDWGNGRDTTGSLTSLASPLVVTSPPYCAPGVYTAHISVTDKDGGTGTNFASTLVQAATVALQPRAESVALRPGGNFSVTVLGSATLDASRLDPLSVTLDVDGVTLTPATRGSGVAFATVSDVNGDGYADMTLRFARRTLTDAATLTSGDAPMALRGTLTDGCTAIAGSGTLGVIAGPR